MFTCRPNKYHVVVQEKNLGRNSLQSLSKSVQTVWLIAGLNALSFWGFLPPYNAFHACAVGL